MTTFIIRRIATIIPTLIFVSLLIFGLQQLLPGDPAMILAGEERDPTVIAHLRETMHLDQPFPVRYLYWLRGVLHGDLGESLRMIVDRSNEVIYQDITSPIDRKSVV